jgi:glycosyltransferase involved in cell wall biosynthesis
MSDTKLKLANNFLQNGEYLTALKIYQEISQVPYLKEIVKFNINHIIQKLKKLNYDFTEVKIEVEAEAEVKAEVIDIKKFVEQKFDAKFYLQNNEDVRLANIDPFIHYYYHGWKEERSPNANFNIRSYFINNPDVKRASIEPYGHYLQFGKEEGRRVSLKLKDAFNLAYDIDKAETCFLLPTKQNYRFNAGEAFSFKDFPVSDKSIGIHLHVHYIQGLEKIIKKIALIREKKHLYISCTSSEIHEKVKGIIAIAKINYTVKIVENRGRDIAPMLLEFKEELKQHDVCLHLHNKQSIEKDRNLASGWANHMLQALIYDEIYVSSVLNLFSKSQCRVISPLIYEPIREQMSWGNNKKIIKNLYEKYYNKKFSYKQCPLFPAGSFYWFKPDLLNELRSVVNGLEDFPQEPIPDDGTLAHALERFIGILEAENNTHILQIRPVDTFIKYKKISPIVSIIIPFFNAERWLPDAINSCLQQDVNFPVEIILVDNLSTDKSLQVAKTYENIYQGKIKTIQEKNKGAGAARNAGVKFCSGAYITFLDADDILTPWSIRTLLESMKNDETINFACGSLRFFSEDDYGNPIPHLANGEILDVENDDNGNWDALVSDFGPCAKMYRKEFIERCDLTFPEGNFEDNFFICKAYFLADKIRIVRNTVYLYRKYFSRDGLTQSTRNEDKDVVDQIKMFVKTAEYIYGNGFDSSTVRKRGVRIMRKFKEKCEHLIGEKKIDLANLALTLNEEDNGILEVYKTIK